MGSNRDHAHFGRGVWSRLLRQFSSFSVSFVCWFVFVFSTILRGRNPSKVDQFESVFRRYFFDQLIERYKRNWMASFEGGAWSISRSQSGGRKNELVSAVHPAASFAAPLSVKKKTSSFAKLSSPSSSSSSIVFVESNRRISTIEFECIFDEKAGGNGKEILKVVHFSLFSLFFLS